MLAQMLQVPIHRQTAARGCPYKGTSGCAILKNYTGARGGAHR